MQTDISGARATRHDGVEKLELSRAAFDREGAHGALTGVADAGGFVRRIEMRAGGIDDEATRTGAHLDDAIGFQLAGFAIHLEKMNPPPISRRQIHLGRQHILER